jgi:nucleoside-diphosphate-sugar epimerase
MLHALATAALSLSLGSRPAARSTVRMAAGDASALIIQNKGGGHGEIGYHLALQLVKEKGMEVTILHEGPNKGKPPHNAYGDLDAAGVKVIWCDDLTDSAACLGELGGKSFSAVVDNWSKSPEAIAPYAEAAKGWGVDHYAYISSAGMYTPEKGDFGAIMETCAVKSSGQRQAEEKLGEMGLPFTCFRPQYIYGPKQGKSYLAPFFDRASRGKPVLVPGDGSQYVTMTHAADNAAMVAAAIGNSKAVGEVFNCATSSLITYNELAKVCGAAAGVADVPIVNYDPKAASVEIPKGFFPFRDTPFYVSADKAKELLGFEPKHSIADDAAWYFEQNYKAQGGLDKEVDFSLDEALSA